MKTVDFAETIAASDLKVTSIRCRQLIELIKVSGYFLTLAKGHLQGKFKLAF